jgi:hypothetical protein
VRSPPEAEAARELVRLARGQGLSLTGPHGLLKQAPLCVKKVIPGPNSVCRYSPSSAVRQ